MAKTFKRVIISVFVLILLAAAAFVAIYLFSSGTPLESTRTKTLNMAIDKFEVKDKIDTELRVLANECALEYGIPPALAEGAIDMIDVKNWKVVNTPTDAKVNEVLDVDLDSSTLHMTIYDDPSVISVSSSGKINTYGQSISLYVPESARGVPFIIASYDKADDAGFVDFIRNYAGGN